MKRTFTTLFLICALLLGLCACCEDVAAVEAFDATFPPKEKKWMPSQEEFYIYSHSSVVR